MPKLTLYSFWIPGQNPPTILIAGDREIHSLFIEAFPEYNVQDYTWIPRSPAQKMYDYGFFVHNATENDKIRFEIWLESYRTIELVALENNLLDNGYALSYHNGRVSQLVRKAKPYGDEIVTTETEKSAVELVEIMLEHIDCLERTDYFVAVPCLGKDFDLPKFITGELCRRGKFRDGSSYLEQVRTKQYSQKNLNDIEDKRNNVKDLFNVKEGHPFSGKVVTIIDDIYRSGATIDEVAKVIRVSGVRIVQAFVLTKTFRD